MALLVPDCLADTFGNVPLDIRDPILNLCKDLDPSIRALFFQDSKRPLPQPWNSQEALLYYADLPDPHYGSFELQVLYDCLRSRMKPETLAGLLKLVRDRTKTLKGHALLELLRHLAKSHEAPKLIVPGGSLSGPHTSPLYFDLLTHGNWAHKKCHPFEQ